MSHSKRERSKKFPVMPSRQNCKINHTAEDFIYLLLWTGSAIYLKVHKREKFFVSDFEFFPIL
jgi:hypothetical protein